MIGTVGILFAAKKGGPVDVIEELVQALKYQGFWISPALEASTLRSAGEPLPP